MLFGAFPGIVRIADDARRHWSMPCRIDMILRHCGNGACKWGRGSNAANAVAGSAPGVFPLTGPGPRRIGQRASRAPREPLRSPQPKIQIVTRWKRLK